MASCSSSAPAPQGEGVDDDDILIGDPVGLPSAPPGPGGRRHRLRIATRGGIFSGWIIGDTSLPNPAGAADPGPLPGSAAQRVVVGVAQLEWKFVDASQEARVAHAALEPVALGRVSRALLPWGYVQYRTVEVWPLMEAMEVPVALALDGHVASHRLRLQCKSARLTRAYATVADLFSRGPVRSVSVVLVLPRSVAIAVCQSPPTELLRSVGLQLRGEWNDLVQGFPPRASVRRWKADLDVLRVAQVPAMEPGDGDPWADMGLARPMKKKRRMAPASEEAADEESVEDDGDPIKLIKG